MSADDVRVARVGVEEWQAFKELRLEALRREPAAFKTTYAQAVTWPDDAWRARLANPRCATFIARAGGHPIGMAGTCRGDEDDERVGVVISMYVNERHRRRGVGNLLLAAAIDHLTAYPEIATIRLWVSPEQHPARALYASLGFRIVTDAEGRSAALAPGDNRLIMERPAHLRSSEGASPSDPPR